MIHFYQFQPPLMIVSLTVKEAGSRVNIVARPRGLAYGSPLNGDGRAILHTSVKRS